MKLQTLIKNLLIISLVTVTGCLLPVTSVSTAYAFPAMYFAKVCSDPFVSSGVVMPDGRTCCPSNYSSSDNACLFGKYINPAIQLLAVCVGLVVIISIVYGGIEYITSEGDPQKAEAAKKRITNSLIALVAFVLLYAFLQFMVPGGIV